MDPIVALLLVLILLCTIIAWSLAMPAKADPRTVENQEKMIALLEQIRDSKTS